MKIMIFIAGILLLFFLIENIRELQRFKVFVYPIESAKLKGLKQTKRVVFLSDLHNYKYGMENERLYHAIQKLRPDLILIGGDMLVRKDGCSYQETARFLARLTEIATVYCANGNHEQKLKERPESYEQSYIEYKKMLETSGIRFLENETVKICWDGVEVKITGLEIPLYAYGRFKRKPVPLQIITERLGESDDAYRILLAHNPMYADVYFEWGADLILSGHLHGGMVRLPGIGGVIAPDFTVFPKYSGGRYQKAGREIVVSRGLGVHSIPVRLFNPAEVSVLEFSADRACEKPESLV